MKYDDLQQRDEVRTEFNRAVNMPPAQLEDWLATEESESVGAALRTASRSATPPAGGSPSSSAPTGTI